jgi:hypothetical protein
MQTQSLSPQLLACSQRILRTYMDIDLLVFTTQLPTRISYRCSPAAERRQPVCQQPTEVAARNVRPRDAQHSLSASAAH